MVLALVGAPSAFTWEAYKATKAAGGALGALLGAADAAAVAGIVGSAAAVLGAGLGGFLIGQAILNQLQPETSMPDMGEYYEVGQPQQLVRLYYEYKVNGETLFDNQPSQFLLAPIKGIFFRVIDGASTWFVFDGNGTQQNIVSTSNTPGGTEFRIISFELANGTTVTPTKRLPSYVPTRPDRPTPQPPTPITVPGIPTVPVNPIAVPNPGNDEPEEGGERQPGVVVQVPEAGLQIRYTPSGVFISNYNAPNKEPFRLPPINLPPGGKAATPECCPRDEPDPPENKDDEIICRLKTLQEGLLDDGFTTELFQTEVGQSGKINPAGGDIFRVQVTVLSRPVNLPIQSSTAPASDVWFVGWYTWLIDGIESDRKPLHFKETVLEAPERANGFVFQLNAACTGRATCVRRTKKPFVDRCVPL